MNKQTTTQQAPHIFPIEYIHLMTGYILILAWMMGYFSGGFEIFVG